MATSPDGDRRTSATPFDLRLLSTFVAVADELHFGRAAARLHLAQPAVSHQIHRLESQLGVTLFERTSRRVELTRAGRVFLTGAREALALAGQAAHDARQAGTDRRVVRIGIDIDAPSSAIAHLRRFGATHPDHEVRVTVHQQDDALADLAAGRSDLVIGWVGPPADAHLGWAPLTSVALDVVVRRTDRLAELPRVAPRQLARRTLVSYEPSRETRPFYDHLLARLSHGRRSPVRVAHVGVLDDAQHAMGEVVRTNGGYTFCLAEHGHRLGPDLVSRPFDPPIEADLVAMWNAGARPDVHELLITHFRTPP